MAKRQQYRDHHVPTGARRKQKMIKHRTKVKTTRSYISQKAAQCSPQVLVGSVATAHGHIDIDALEKSLK